MHELLIFNASITGSMLQVKSMLALSSKKQFMTKQTIAIYSHTPSVMTFTIHSAVI